jgi:hypothetical protein
VESGSVLGGGRPHRRLAIVVGTTTGQSIDVLIALARSSSSDNPMDPVVATLVGSLIGAAIGVAGGVFTTTYAIRSDREARREERRARAYLGVALYVARVQQIGHDLLEGVKPRVGVELPWEERLRTAPQIAVLSSSPVQHAYAVAQAAMQAVADEFDAAPAGARISEERRSRIRARRSRRRGRVAV